MVTRTRRDFLKTGAAAALVTGALSADGVVLTSAAAATAAAPPSSEVKTGGIRMIPIMGGKYRVWTKKVGSGPIKVLLLHGGPGCTHEYFECFEDFLPQQGVEYYYYDQLGSHYSDQPDDVSLWTVDRFREEVEEVRRALGLENFYLYGQSWGGMLGIEYALKYGKHLKGLVISNMTASIASYLKYANELRGRLPADVQATMARYEAKGDFDAPEYQDIMFNQIYSQYVCRIKPLPEPAERTFKHLATKVYNTMQGPNEFVITGNFKDWDRWKDLPSLTMPTLLIVGRHDEMNPADIRKMNTLIPHSRFLECPNGSHLSLYDDQETYMRGLVTFLKDVQARRFKG